MKIRLKKAFIKKGLTLALLWCKKDYICPPQCRQLWLIFWLKKTLFNEGKYSLGNSSKLPINCDIEMKYLWQWIVTKTSGFRMFYNTPLFRPCQKAPALNPLQRPQLL